MLPYIHILFHYFELFVPNWNLSLKYNIDFEGDFHFLMEQFLIYHSQTKGKFDMLGYHCKCFKIKKNFFHSHILSAV